MSVSGTLVEESPSNLNPTLKLHFDTATAADALVTRQKEERVREHGMVQGYDKSKGFGFIIDSDKEKLFVHQSQIVAPGFRRLYEGQRISFVRGENRGKPWAEDVKNPDGSPIMSEKEDETPNPKRRRQLLKEQWRNFFDIPQYKLKAHGESWPSTSSNQDCFVLGEAVPQLGNVFVLAHGCCATGTVGNDCSRFIRDKFARSLDKAYEEKSQAVAALQLAFEAVESEFMERAKMKTITDASEMAAVLFVHALNSSGQPCVQVFIANAGTNVVLLCTGDGNSVRISEPHTTAKEQARLLDAGFNVDANGIAEVAFAEVGEHRPKSAFRLPASRLIGGRPFKTAKSPVSSRPDVRKAREWRCVAGEELFMLVCSSEVLSMLSDQDVVNAALDVWGSSAENIAGWEAAAKAVVRTAKAQGPETENLACLVVQFWWQEKPLQKLLARRLDKKRSGVPRESPTKPVEGETFDMFG